MDTFFCIEIKRVWWKTKKKKKKQNRIENDVSKIVWDYCRVENYVRWMVMNKITVIWVDWYILYGMKISREFCTPRRPYFYNIIFFIIFTNSDILVAIFQLLLRNEDDITSKSIYILFFICYLNLIFFLNKRHNVFALYFFLHDIENKV